VTPARALALCLVAATLTFAHAIANPSGPNHAAVAAANAAVRDAAVASPTGAPQATVDAASHDFGRVARGSVVSATFVIHNVGVTPLTIQSMEFSSPGVRAHVTQNITPGGSAELVADWNTADYTRDAEVQIALKLNDPASPELVLMLSCFVVSPIELDPVPAFYLSEFAGERSSQTVTLRNNMDRILKVTGTTQQGQSFTLAVEPVTPGRAFAVTATAAPGLQPGAYHESAWILTDDPARPKVRLDVNILVKTEVHASVDGIDMGRVNLSTLKANPSVLELMQQTVILESRSADLRITRIESDLPFVTVHQDPDHAGRRIRLDVGVDQARLRTGDYAGNLRVYTGVPTYPVVTLPVTMSVAN